MTMTSRRPPRVLSIAGSDSSGGAGIQADIKTATALGAYAMTAITAVTAQDTMGVHAVQLVPPDLVAAQIRACLDDIGADAIKIGMLGSGEIAAAVAGALEGHADGVPIVIDPVLVSTSGTRLLDEAGMELLRARLLPLATLVTPNLPELELLSGVAGNSEAALTRAVEALLAQGAKGVLVKGGHRAGPEAIDVLVMGETTAAFARDWIDTPHTHGTGCTLSTAIAVMLARGDGPVAAVKRAGDFVHAAIASAPGFGKGRGPLNHMHGQD